MTAGEFRSTSADTAPPDVHDRRHANRNKILRSLIARGPATRAELSRRTGMSRPTVSAIAGELLTHGVLAEGPRISSGGAPGTLLEIAKDTGVTVVVDLRRGGSLTIGTVSARGEVVGRTTLEVTSTDQAFDAIVDHVRSLERQALIGVSPAVRGFVDPMGRWSQDPRHCYDPQIVDDLRRTLRMPVVPVNAFDAITVADLRDSPEGLTGHATIVVPEATSGIILEGHLLTGWQRSVGVITHLVPGIPGPTCPECHRCCLWAHTRAALATDTARNRTRLASSLAAIMAPVVMSMEVQQVVLAEVPEQMAADLAARTWTALGERMDKHYVPTVRLSGQGDQGVLLGAAAMVLFSRLV